MNKNEVNSILQDVIEVRREGKNTPSSQKGYRLVDTLIQLIETNFYKEDYETNTLEFISRHVAYEEVIKSIKCIAEDDFLPDEIN